MFTKYHNTKAAVQKIIASIIIEAKNNKKFINFYLNTLFYLFSVISEKVSVILTVFEFEAYELLNQLTATEEHLNLDQYFEYLTAALAVSGKLAGNHLNEIYSHYRFILSTQNDTLSESIKSRIGIANAKSLSDSSNQKLELTQQQLVDIFIQSQSAERKSEVSPAHWKARIQMNQAFVKAFSLIPNILKTAYTADIEVIMCESLKFDPKLYEICIRGIYKFESEILRKYQPVLMKLTDKKTIKDALFSIDWNSMTLGERASAMKIVVPTLISLYFDQKGHKNKQMKMSQKNFILYCVSNFNLPEIIQTIHEFLEFIGFDFLKMNRAQIIATLAKTQVRTLQTLMEFLERTIKNFALQIDNIAKEFLYFLTEIYQVLTLASWELQSEATKTIDGEQGMSKTHINSKLKESRRVSFNLLCKILSTYLELDFDDFVKTIIPLLSTRISNLETAENSAVAGPLKLISIFSEFERYKTYLIEYQFLLPSLFSVLKKPQLSDSTAMSIIAIINNLLEYAPGNSAEMVANSESVVKQKAKALRLVNLFSQGFVTQPRIEDELTLKNQSTSVSVLGRHIIHSNVAIIIESLTTFFKNKSKESKKYQVLANPTALQALIQIFNNIEISDQAILDQVIQIAFYYFSPKNLKRLNYKDDVLTAEDNNDGGMEIRVASRVENYLKVVQIISESFRVYHDSASYFTSKIVPLLIDIERPEILLALSQISQAITQNPTAHSIHASAEFMTKILKPNRKIDNDLDYDNVYEQLQIIKPQIPQFSHGDQQTILSIVFRLIGSHDLGTRIKALEILDEYFGRVFQESENIDQEQFDTKTSTVVYLINFLPTLVKRSFGKEDGLKNYVALLSSYLKFAQIFIDSNPRGIDYQKLPFYDLYLFVPSNILLDLFSLKLKQRTVAMIKFREEFQNLDKSALKYTSTSMVIIPLLENILISQYTASFSKEIKNFRKQESNRAQFSSFAGAVATLIAGLSSQFSLTKLVAYVAKKLNLIQKRPQYKIIFLNIIERLLDNLSLYSGLTDSIKQIDAQLRTQKEQILSAKHTVQDFYNFENLPDIQIIRKKYQRFSKKAKMHKIDSDIPIDSAVAFNTMTDSTANGMEVEEQERDIVLENNVRKLTGPILKKLRLMLFDSKSKEEDLSMRIQVAQCLLKILRNLPADQLVEEFAKILMELTQMLKSKDQKQRLKTLKTLLNIAKQTGPYMFHFIVSELKFHLTDSIFKHVRNFAVWYLMNQVIDTRAHIPYFPEEEKLLDFVEFVEEDDEKDEGENGVDHENQSTDESPDQQQLVFDQGSLDYIYGDIADIVTEETFSDMFAEKDNEDRKNKTREIKKHKARAILQLFATQTDISSGAVI